MTATDGPYCPCGWHRVQAHGQLCPCCEDDRRRAKDAPKKSDESHT